jgi:hypothetical protein
VVAVGFVFGISMNDVTPPATAARASLAMQPYGSGRVPGSAPGRR